jgi:dTDP-4-amino-4,6-dideoxygalactose transaminase
LKQYKQGLSKIGFSFQENDEISTVAFVSTLAPSSASAELAYRHLNSVGVEVKKYYSPLHMQAIFNDLSIIADNLDNTEEIFSRIISLPLHDSMTNEVIDEVVEHVKISQRTLYGG